MDDGGVATVSVLALGRGVAGMSRRGVLVTLAATAKPCVHRPPLNAPRVMEVEA